METGKRSNSGRIKKAYLLAELQAKNRESGGEDFLDVTVKKGAEDRPDNSTLYILGGGKKKKE